MSGATQVGTSITQRCLARLKEGGRWKAILGLSPTVLMAGLFWAEVAIDPLTAPAMLLDRGLQLASLGLLPALIMVAVAPIVPALYASLYGGLVGTALSLSIGLTAVVRPPADLRMVLLSVLAAGSAVWVLWRFTDQLGWLQSTASKVAVLLVASAVPLLQFWNGTSFLTARTEVGINQEVAAEFDDASHGILRYTATNLTDARALVIISQLSVCWWTPQEDVDYDVESIRNRPNCSVERPINQRSWIAGSAALVWQVALAPPPDKPRMTVLARVAVARGDRLRISSDGQYKGDVGDCADVIAYRLQEESRVKGVAQDDKYLVYADVDRDGGTNYYFHSGSDIDCPFTDPDRLWQYFGASEQSVVYETWVTPGTPAPTELPG